MNSVLSQLHHRLIVSCQPTAPLDAAAYVADLAATMVECGAAGIRANGAEHVRSVAARVKVPIIGINKQRHAGHAVYITPTVAAANDVLDAGCQIVAFDGTPGDRPDGSTVGDLVSAVHERGALAMADVSTGDEGLRAAEAGADLVATTLSGYTPHSPRQDGPDLELVQRLAARGVPVVAEGRYNTPERVEAALEGGAFAVVVGRAITDVRFLVRPFVEVVESRSGRGAEG